MREEDGMSVWVVLILMLAGAVACLARDGCLLSSAEGQDFAGLAMPERRPHPAPPPIPACQWTPTAKDALVRMVEVETSDDAERLTIAWVLARRWRARGPARRAETFARSVVAFSQVLRRLDDALMAGLALPDAANRAGVSPHQRRILASSAGYVGRNARITPTLDAWADGSLPGDGCAWDARGPAFNWRAPRRGDSADAHLLSCPGYNAFYPPSPEQLVTLRAALARVEVCP